MRGVLGTAAEALLWPLGIRRKQRRVAPRDRGDGAGEGGPPSEEDESGWEVDPCHLLSATAGALIAWWAMGKLKAASAGSLQDASAAPGYNGAGQAALPRMALSDFIRLLRAGAITAVTYLADRPPAGSLVVKATMPLALAAVPQLLGTAVSSTGTCTAETLLMPGSHQGLFDELRGHNVFFECADVATAEPDFSRLSLLIDAGGLCASLAALVYLLRGSSNQGLFSGRHLEDAAHSDAERRPGVTFADVAGMEGTKEELREVISFLRNPRGFYALGARPPRGLLLAGPSGTGKTLLARAVAGEAGVPFLYASSAAFVEVFVGQGAQRIRQFFEQARACAPCIVFLDELDAVGAARQMASTGGNQEYAQTLNQLLLELDGVESRMPTGSEAAADSSPLVVTIAATNRYDCLDEALVRPGRLDRIVLVGLPNRAERVATLQIHARRLRSEGLDFEAIAGQTEGKTGADLSNLLNEAALLAARHGADAVRMEHVEQVLRTPRPPQRPQPRGESWWAPPEGRDADLGGLASSPDLLTGLLAAAAAMAAGRGMALGPQVAADAGGLD